MRPIDADSMKAEVESLDAESNNRIYQCAMEDMLEFFIELIDKQPTIEPKRGEWIIKPHGSYGQLRAFCSACGKHSGIGGIESNQRKPFCPNCGADMREVLDNG